MTIRELAAGKLSFFALLGFALIYAGLGDHRSPSNPGWILMGASLISLLFVFRLPALTRTRSSLANLLANLDRSLASQDDYRALELLTDARRTLGTGASEMHLQLDLAEGTLMFRKGRYEDAVMSLERCFLNAFAINDAKYGGESGLLLLKTLVALGRYREASEFALGVRQMTKSPELDHLVALASNRLESTTVRR